MPGVCLNSWQTYGCEWSIRYLWHWMNWFGRLDVILLALMLAHIVAVVARFSYRYRLARRAEAIGTASRAFHRGQRKFIADLSREASGLKSIASTAPFLGLAGTCTGVLSAFRGIGMQKQAALAMMITGIGAALITTATGLLVAVPATLSYNYLRTRIDLLDSEMHNEAVNRTSRSYQVARKLPLRERFSKVSFAVIAAPGLAILVAVFTMFSSSYSPRGLAVGLVSARCEYEGDDRLIVLRIIRAGDLFLNTEPEDWNSLAGLLSEIYKMRVHRTLYLVADNDVAFQTVADAIDIVQSTPLAPIPQELRQRNDEEHITVRLVTPRAVNVRCVLP
jgi:biopolymer transport protein ExbB/TolQ/biopolymer transport protein ExbD